MNKQEISHLEGFFTGIIIIISSILYIGILLKESLVFEIGLVLGASTIMVLLILYIIAMFVK